MSLYIFMWTHTNKHFVSVIFALNYFLNCLKTANISLGIFQQINSLKLMPYFAIAKITKCVAKTNFYSPDFVVALDFVLRSHLW